MHLRICVYGYSPSNFGEARVWPMYRLRQQPAGDGVVALGACETHDAPFGFPAHSADRKADASERACSHSSHTL